MMNVKYLQIWEIIKMESISNGITAKLKSLNPGNGALVINAQNEDAAVIIQKIQSSQGSDTIIFVIGDEIACLVDNYLVDLGFTESIPGIGYIKDAILLILKSGRTRPIILKRVYREIADEKHASQRKVERSIGRAVEKAFGKNGRDAPANSEFLKTAVEKIRSAMQNKKD
jgi:hypothetical protein